MKLNSKLIDKTDFIKNTSNNSTTNTYSCDYINGHVLYTNVSGTTADITLSDNCSNYSYIEIFYGSGDGDIKSTRTLPGSRILLFTIDMRSSSNSVVIRGANKLVSGTSLSNTVYSSAVDYGQWVNNGGFSKTNYIKIYKVLGYK